MKRVSAKIHPTVVDRGSKSNNLNVCYDLREQDGNDPQILSKVLTGDETGCYGYDPLPPPKKNRQRANAKLLTLQTRRRLDRFDQMLRSC